MRISDWSSDVCSSDLLALMECLDAETRELRYVLCAVGRDGEDYVFTPFGHLAPGNPFNAYLPPAGGGGFAETEREGGREGASRCGRERAPIGLTSSRHPG